ncbi:hypothetical protein D3C83_145190 [compost metagenome]
MNETRCFELTCAVTRPMNIERPCVCRAGRLSSPIQSQRDRSPVLALAMMPSTAVSVFSLR